MLRCCFLLILMLPTLATAQFTLTGPRGMINVPHAEVLQERSFMVGMHTNNENYQLIDYGANRPPGSEYVSSLTIGFLPRVNLTLMLSRIFGDPMQTVGQRSSIGDRSMQLTFLILKEQDWRPSLVLNVADPYSNSQFFAGNHLVATKKFIKSDRSVLKGTFGYGFPFVILFSTQAQRVFTRKESDYLKNLFGGISYEFLPANIQCSVEYDGWNINTGFGITFWDRLSIQAYLQGLKYPGFGFNYVGNIR